MVVMLDDDDVDDDVYVGVGAFVCGGWRVLPTESAESSGPWLLGALAESVSFYFRWLCCCYFVVVIVVIGFHGCCHPALCVVALSSALTMMIFVVYFVGL